MTNIDMQHFRRGLPIFEYKEKIEKTVKESDFCIVTGDTGSGKSTQLPQYMIDSEVIRQQIIENQPNVEEYAKGIQKPITSINVIITQPRRMAAVSMATRVCDERSTKLGD